MKKILLLGGSAQQVVAIETAKRMGYYTVLCDYLPDNPGQYVADKFYLVSTTDKNAVLEVAKKENVDGVLAYASDPAAPTAAYVAEKLGLPGNPYESVEILCNKDKFRRFLAENGFSTPEAKSYVDIDKAKSDLSNGEFSFPVIVKPVDSSGSKGVTVLYENKEIERSLVQAFSFSRCNKIIVEQYIEKKHEYLIGGDIFVIDGAIAIWGLMNCHRDSRVNNLVPAGKSFPLDLEEADKRAVKDTLDRLVKALHFCNGGMNVELVVDERGDVFPIDIGPRTGGNMIPDLLGYIFNVDVVAMSVQAAMGKKVDICQLNETRFFATHNLHSDKNGIYRDICFSPILEQFIIRKELYKKSGDEIEVFDNAAKALGIIFLKFESQEQMQSILNSITDMYDVVLE